MRGKGAAKLKCVRRPVGVLGASGACKKHLILYGTATRTPLRETPLLGPRPHLPIQVGFFDDFLKKLRFFMFLKIYMLTPMEAASGTALWHPFLWALSYISLHFHFLQKKRVFVWFARLHIGTPLAAASGTAPGRTLATQCEPIPAKEARRYASCCQNS